MSSRFKQAVCLVSRHPAYIYSRLWPIYSRYERARLRALQRRGLSAVFCMRMFYMFPDPADSNTGVTSSILLRGGFYEPESTAVFMQLLRPGDTVVDIGANIGWYTLIGAKNVGSRGKVVACEPEPHNFRLLKASLRLNHMSNVIPIGKCVSDNNDRVMLGLSGSNAGGHSIVATGLEGRKLEVDSTTLDNLVETLDLRQVDVIKMDAESSEPLIFLGATKLLSRGQPRAILMEFSPLAWAGCQDLLLRILADFDAHEIINSTLRRVSIPTLPKARQAMLLLTRRHALDSRQNSSP